MHSIAKAKAETEIVAAEAKAQKIALIAEAEAKAIRIRAKAAQEARKLKGQGDKEYAMQVEASALGGQLAKIELQRDTLQGINKVAYVPQIPGLLGNCEVNVDANDLSFAPARKRPTSPRGG